MTGSGSAKGDHYYSSSSSSVKRSLKLTARLSAMAVRKIELIISLLVIYLCGPDGHFFVDDDAFLFLNCTIFAYQNAIKNNYEKICESTHPSTTWGGRN